MFFHRITIAAATILIAAPADSTSAPRTDPPVVPTVADTPDQGRPNIADPQATVQRRADVVVPGELSKVEQSAVRWAKGRFESAGIELPEVAISFSADSDDCNGEQGVYRRRSGEHSVVVCVPDREGAAIDHRRKRTLLHELAHAWDHATLTDSDRRDLQWHFDADDWYATDRPWEERPVEQLAETLTWGLLDQPRRPLLIDRACGDVHADFRSIVGRRPLGSIEPLCEIDDEPHRQSGSAAAAGSPIWTLV